MIRGFFFRDGAFPRKGLALSFLLIVLAAGLLPARAQRLLQPLSRSVVALFNGNSVGISWRLLAQDAPGVQFNLYKRNADGSDFQKINQAPLSATCYQTTLAEVPYNTQLAVSSITGGVESDLSAPFLFKKQAWRCLLSSRATCWDRYCMMPLPVNISRNGICPRSMT